MISLPEIVNIYAQIVSVAFPITVIFHLGNRLISTILGAATGGYLRF